MLLENLSLFWNLKILLQQKKYMFWYEVTNQPNRSNMCVHWSQQIMYEFHNIPLKKKNPCNCRHIIFVSVPRTHAASRKGPLDGADLPSFNARVVDPAQSSRDVPVNLTLQLTRRESSSVIKGGTCRYCQAVPNVRLWEPIWEEID